MSKTDYLPSIKRAVDFIEKNLKEPIGVNDVCDLFEISPWQFQRLFRLYTGDSIGNYLRARRLTSAALELIENPNAKILDVAINYEFGSQEAFTRAFKTFFDTTPGQIQNIQSEVRTRLKPILSDAQLTHNLKGIQREPEIVEFQPMNFVGQQIEINSPFYEGNTYEKDVLNLWLTFSPRRSDIQNRMPALGYGLINGVNGLISDEKFVYTACAEVSSVIDVPQDMIIQTLPKQRYAVFEKRGLEDKTKMSIDYIYGFWLPQSNYKRGHGPDIEIVDKRLNLANTDSVSRYSIPIT